MELATFCPCASAASFVPAPLGRRSAVAFAGCSLCHCRCSYFSASFAPLRLSCHCCRVSCAPEPHISLPCLRPCASSVAAVAFLAPLRHSLRFDLALLGRRCSVTADDSSLRYYRCFFGAPALLGRCCSVAAAGSSLCHCRRAYSSATFSPHCRSCHCRRVSRAPVPQLSPP